MPKTKLDMNCWINEQDDGTHTIEIQVTGLPNYALAEAVSLWLRDMVNESSRKMDGPITFHKDN